jgi:hypothetical protein
MKKKKLYLIGLLLACGMFTFANVSNATTYVDGLMDKEIDVLIECLEKGESSRDGNPDNPFGGTIHGYITG